MSPAIAVTSADSGREATKSVYFADGTVGAASMVEASSAWTITSPSKVATSCIAARSWAASTGGNSSTPDGSRKHLKPITPASHSGRSWAVLPGTIPPQNPRSTASASRAAACFTRSDATSIVGGMEFSGMSTRVVTPPSAAARVAVAKPSHSVRPGSLMCTWVSTFPGSTCRPSGTTRVPGRRGASSGSGRIAVIRPSSMSSSAATSRSPSSISWARTVCSSPELVPAFVAAVFPGPGMVRGLSRIRRATPRRPAGRARRGG